MEGHQVQERQGVFISHSICIKALIVDTESETTILLFDEKETSTHWRRTRTHQARRQRLTDVPLHRYLLRSQEIVKLDSIQSARSDYQR